MIQTMKEASSKWLPKNTDQRGHGKTRQEEIPRDRHTTNMQNWQIVLKYFPAWTSSQYTIPNFKNRVH